MKIYHYHSTTGALLGEGLADESPLEPGVWLIPAFATNAVPPADVETGKHLFFDGTTWVPTALHQDHISLVEPPPIGDDPAPEMKLQSLGMTVDDLKHLLGIG